MLQVVDAMRQTITNILGTLVPEFFEVSISAKGEDLAQLMYTIMMSGYMFRNAQYRLELRDSMLPSGPLSFAWNKQVAALEYCSAYKHYLSCLPVPLCMQTPLAVMLLLHANCTGQQCNHATAMLKNDCTQLLPSFKI